MGARCLRRWIDSPLLNIDEINKRQNIISNFLESKKLRTDTQNILRAMGDFRETFRKSMCGACQSKRFNCNLRGVKKIT